MPTRQEEQEEQKEASHVTPEGRTIVDMNVFLRDPKVRATLDRVAKQTETLKSVRVLRKASAGA